VRQSPGALRGSGVPMSLKEKSSHRTLLPLSLGIALNTGIFVAEVVGGLLSGSLALLSDALHNLADIFPLFTAFFALRLALRARTPGKTYGYRRAEILAAFVSYPIAKVRGLQLEAASGPTDRGPSASASQYA